MAHMDTSEFPDSQIFCETYRLMVIHVFCNMVFIRYQCIHEEQVHTDQEFSASFGDWNPGISRISYAIPPIADDKAAAVCRRVVYQKKRQCHSIKGKRGIRFNRVSRKWHKSEYPTAIRKYGRGCIYRREVLDPIELPIAHKMVIMPMCPDDCVDVGGSLQEELLPEVRRGINKDMVTLVFQKKRGPQPHSTCLPGICAAG